MFINTKCILLHEKYIFSYLFENVQFDLIQFKITSFMSKSCNKIRYFI